MKVTREGVFFKLGDDLMLFRWASLWSSTARYGSSLLSRDFNNFPEYWKERGRRDQISKLVSTQVPAKSMAFSLYDLVSDWSRQVWPNEYLVILMFPDPKQREKSFWEQLPKAKAEMFVKDILVFRCKDMTEAQGILGSIEYKFSEAVIVINGEIKGSNDEAWYLQ